MHLCVCSALVITIRYHHHTIRKNKNDLNYFVHTTSVNFSNTYYDKDDRMECSPARGRAECFVGFDQGRMISHFTINPDRFLSGRNFIS